MKRVKTQNKAVLLLSGGMDSVTLLHWLARRVGAGNILALSFNYGQRHSRELNSAAWQAHAVGVRKHEIVNVPFIGRMIGPASVLTDPASAVPTLSSLPRALRDQPPTYVPNRNMILLSLAAAFAESHGVTEVFYAAQAQDEYGYWDCTKAFVGRINRVLSLNRRKPARIKAPFVGLSKAQVLHKGLALGVDYAHTWSCYRGTAKPCGTCPSCTERLNAFRLCGKRDPLIGTLHRKTVKKPEESA